MLNHKQKEILKIQLKNNIILEFNDTNKTEQINLSKKYLFKRCCNILENDPACNEPEKTIIVAIIYSLLIEKYFNISFYDSLNNDLLLAHNSKFFKSYTKNKKIYKNIIKHYGKSNILSLNSNAIKTITEYFKKEFSLI